MANNRLVGHVYVLKNDCMPGLLKIGYTTRSVYERLRELNSSTSIPKPFTVVHSRASISPHKDEKMIHSALSQYRHGKEFFEIDKETAISHIDQIMAPSIEIALKIKVQQKAKLDAEEIIMLKKIKAEDALAEQKKIEAVKLEIREKQELINSGIRWIQILLFPFLACFLGFMPLFIVFGLIHLFLPNKIYMIVTAIIIYVSIALSDYFSQKNAIVHAKIDLEALKIKSPDKQSNAVNNEPQVGWWC